MSRWVAGGVVAGALWALVGHAPAAWLASAVQRASDGRLLLADARGTVWRGSAVAVLTGGRGSRDASALPGRFEWVIGGDGLGLRLQARQACCIDGELALRLQAGLQGWRVELPPSAAAAALGQWPAGWLAGLGAPWNTIRPTGTLRLLSPGMSLQQRQGAWHLAGRASLELQSIASRVSPLAALGSYRVDLEGAAAPDGPATLRLTTLDGPLQIDGSGAWGPAGLRFRGQARAAPGAEAALNNLLNFIGRRQGALSVLSIG